MFVPFLPLVVIYAVLLAVTGFGVLPQPSWGLMETASGFLLMLMTGAVIGNLPDRWAGPHNPIKFTRRKLVHLALWVSAALWSPVFAGMAMLLSPLGISGEGVALLFMLNYWVSDALAQHPIVVTGPPSASVIFEDTRERPWLQKFWGTLRITLPVIGLLCILTAATALWDAAAPGWEGLEIPWWAGTFGSIAMYLLVMGALVPLLIRFGWGLRPLQSAQADKVIREELAANGIRGIGVYAWPEHLMQFATAGVIGLIPGFRILLFGDSLTSAYTSDEIRSVTAHEAAHIRHRHLWFYLAAIVALLTSLQVVIFQILSGGLLLGIEIPADALIVVEIAALLIFLRYGMGYLSRGFERQADAHALQRWGLANFHGALSKLAVLNRIPTQQANWHHFGISQRLAFLEKAQSDPPMLERHHARVRRMKGMILGFLVLAIMAQAVFSATNVVGFMPEGVWLRWFESMQEPTPSATQAVKFLGARAHERGNSAQAKRWFKQWLRWAPDDPIAQNNLGWLLVTDAESTNDDRAWGLRLARQAARKSEQAFIWDTLAEAHWRNHQALPAIRAARRALALASAGQGTGDVPPSYYWERVQYFDLGGAETR